MGKLGYTWWPKDWAASQKVQSLDIIERGVYRELIDLVMDHEEPIKPNIKLWSRLWRIDESKLIEVLSLLGEIGATENTDGCIWIPSVEQRLSKTKSRRENSRNNGKKGGRPPKINPKETQKKPSGFTTETTTETTTEKFSFIKSLIDLGVEEQVAKDWLTVRKTKKASNTETAFTQIKNQIKNSGRSANECITIAVENSWKGFKVDWLNDEVRKESNMERIKRERGWT